MLALQNRQPQNNNVNVIVIENNLNLYILGGI